MDMRRKSFSLVLVVAASTFATGCLSAASVDRTNNQGGGSVVTAGAKIASGKIGNLTADEIQLVHDKALELNPDLSVPELTDDQAAAAVEFLDANGLDTLDDVVNLIDEAAENPDTVVIPDSVQSVLEGILG